MSLSLVPESGSANPRYWPDRYNTNLVLIQDYTRQQDTQVLALSAQEQEFNSSIEQITNDYNNLETLVNDEITTILELSAQNIAISASIDILNNNYQSLSGIVSNHDTSITELSGQVIALSASVNNVTNNYTSLETLIASISSEGYSSLVSVAGSASIDMSLATKYKIILTENTIITNPINANDGDKLLLRIKQNDIGGWMLNFDTKFSINNDYSSLTITTSGSRYILNAIYDSSDDVFDSEIIGS